MMAYVNREDTSPVVDMQSRAVTPLSMIVTLIALTGGFVLNVLLWRSQSYLAGRMGRGAARLVTFLQRTLGITPMTTASAFFLHSARAGSARLATHVVLTGIWVPKRAMVRTCVRMGCALHVDRLVCSAAQMVWKIMETAPFAIIGLTACKVIVNTVVAGLCVLRNWRKCVMQG